MMKACALICLFSTVMAGGQSPSRGEADLSGTVVKVIKSRARKKDANSPIGSILVEGSAAETHKSRAVVRIGVKTRLFVRQNGELRAATFESLKAGQKVEVTFSGPVIETYPIQVTAAEVIILD